MSFLPAPFGAGPLADIVGRKWALLTSTIFYVVSYILLVTATSVGQMYAARLIQVTYKLDTLKRLMLYSYVTIELVYCVHYIKDR